MLRHEIATTPEIEGLIAARAPVAIGVSGGKDSGALALALMAYLDARNHPRNQRVLIHSHLGAIEWPESLEWCQRLAAHTGIELIVTQRAAGGLLDRWERRWEANFGRYSRIECLKLIVPWSSAKLKFCTGELKIEPICRTLKRRFPGQRIISASGIRAEESSSRSKAPITKEQPKLLVKTIGTSGIDWHPLLNWKIEEVFAIHEEAGFPLHPAYTEFGASRVSCSFCVLSNPRDQAAALKHPGNREAFRRICELELKSAFSFHSNRWLCDLDSEVFAELIADGPERLKTAKEIVEVRTVLEKTLPDELRFVAGTQWPPRLITPSEASIIARVRNSILGLYGVSHLESPEYIHTTLNARVNAEVCQLL